jgi:hypothetical protein
VDQEIISQKIHFVGQLCEGIPGTVEVMLMLGSNSKGGKNIFRVIIILSKTVFFRRVTIDTPEARSDFVSFDQGGRMFEF